MILDIPTVVMIAAVQALIVGASLRFTLRDYPASLQPSIRLWLMGTLALPTGWMLYLLRDRVPDFVSIVVANGLLGLAFAKYLEAIRRFVGRPDNTALILAPVAAIVACEVLFTFVVPNMRLRGVTVSAIIAVQLWCAVTALIGQASFVRRSHRLTAVSFAILSLALGTRALTELLTQQGLSAPFAPSPMQTVVYALAAIFPVAATLGFLLMCNDRLNQALVRNQERLRAITDNLPTIVAHVDTNERFTFANAYMIRLLGNNEIVGRTMREVLGARIYADVQPHVLAALGGKSVTFELQRDYGGRRRYFEATYVPDTDSHGGGFYVLIFDISRLKHAEQELMRLAQHDSLTGLANRNKFDETLSRCMALMERDGRPLGLFYIDIDRFKDVNDTHGHGVGDAVLVEFATRLRSCLRETDLAVRLGGDEFAVLFENLDSMQTLEQIARRLLATLDQDFLVEECRLRVSASIGIGMACCRAESDTLLCRTDHALYEAKAAGRHTYRIAGSAPTLT